MVCIIKSFIYQQVGRNSSVLKQINQGVNKVAASEWNVRAMSFSRIVKNIVNNSDPLIPDRNILRFSH